MDQQNDAATHRAQLTAECHQEGFKAGLQTSFIQQLIDAFGPFIAQLLVKTLLQTKLAATKPQAVFPDLSSIKTLLATLLKTYRTDLLATVDAEAAKGIDALIAALGG